MRLQIIIPLIVAGSLMACVPSANNAPTTDRYTQSVTLKEALIVNERNELEPNSSGSSSEFVQKGILISAKHVTHREDDNVYKVFFNGRAYKGTFVKTPPLSDLFLLRIENLDLNSAPEPYPLGPDAKVGDRVFVRGIHPHSEKLQKGHLVFPILSQYYSVPRGIDEFTYDDLPARVSVIGVATPMSEVGGADRWLDSTVNLYTEIMTDDDHMFSFGGLSGGPVVNEAGQMVGVFVIGLNPSLGHEKGFKYRKAWMVPASELKVFVSHLSLDK